jgi:hypothetical protein
MKPTRDQLQRYLLSAERGPVSHETAVWARRVLEDAIQREEHADHARPSLLPEPRRYIYHTR